MSFIIFPEKLTSQEELLLKSYAKLKKRKEQVEAQKAAARQKKVEQESKRPTAENAVEAKEHAKRLLQTGQIKLQADRSKQSFKRSKRKDSEKSSAQLTFQPFDSTRPEEEELRIKPKSLYENFVPEKRPRPAPKRSKLVRLVGAEGQLVTEEMAREVVEGCGTVEAINVEENGSVLVTFTTPEAADQVLEERKEMEVCGVRITSSIARSRQQQEVPPTPEDASWTDIAKSKAQRGATIDTREQTTYEDFYYD